MGRQEDSPSNPMAWDQGPCTTQGDKLIWNIHKNTEGRFEKVFSQLLSRTIQFLTFLTFYCQKSSLGFKHFICFSVKSQFPLGDKVKVDKFRASSPCRQQIYSQQSSNVVHGVFKAWPYPEVKEYSLPVFKGVYFQAPSFGKCLIWQAKIVIVVQRAENEADYLHTFGWKCYTR